MYLFLLNILYILCEYTEGDHLDLSGKWILQNRNGSIVVNEALVPGYVHTALLKANVIDDPYFRNNDEVYRWIDYDDWTYSKTFDCEYKIFMSVTSVYHEFMMSFQWRNFVLKLVLLICG
jgi:beta-mannosidase